MPLVCILQGLRNPGLGNPGFSQIATWTQPKTKTPHPAPQTCQNKSLHSTMHSYTFPYKAGRVSGDLGGGFGGAGRGVAIYENPWFPVSKPRVSQSQNTVEWILKVFSSKTTSAK